MELFNFLLKYKYLLYTLVDRDIKKKYRRSVLGIFWSMLNPLMMMIITAMVFSTLFRFEIENYVLYLLVGQVAFSFYSESTNFAMGSILENSSLIKKVYVPKYLFPLSRVLSSCVNLLLTIPAIIIMMVYTGQHPTINIIYIVIPLVSFLIFNFGVGLILSATVVYLRDIFHLYGVLLTALNYATPIFYPEKIVPDEFKFLIILNPIYYFVKGFREVFYLGATPTMDTTVICYVIASIFFFIGLFVFKNAQKKFILYI